VRIERGDQAKIIVESLENNLSLAKEQVIQVGVSKASRRNDVETKVTRKPQIMAKKPPSTDAIAGRNQTTTVDQEVNRIPTKKQSAPGVSLTPPPPPNFEDFENSSTLSDQTMMENETSVANGFLDESVSTIANSNVAKSKSNEESKRSILVEIEADPSWRDTCRQVVEHASQFRGNDALHIRVAGQKLAMEFPNQNTDICPELVESVKQINSVVSIEVSQL
jgi:hypothetical protein